MKNFRIALRDHRYLMAYCCAYMGIVTAISLRLGARLGEYGPILTYFSAASFFYLLFPSGIMLAYLIRAFARKPGKPPLAYLRDGLALFEESCARYARDGRLVAGIVGLAAIYPVISFLGIAKSLIPRLAPYHLDPLFADIDRALHFGVYPHEWLVRFSGGFELVALLDKTYLAWFAVIFFAQAYCLFIDTDKARRMRYLWTIALMISITGSLMATLLSSVGPLFYAEYYEGASPYRDFMIYLNLANETRPLQMFSIKDLLTDMVGGEGVIHMNAISAMPSLHVGLAASLCFYSWSINRLVWLGSVLFALSIFFGSVLLGWHYAADGYVATLLCALSWQAAKIIVRKTTPDFTGPEMQEPENAA